MHRGPVADCVPGAARKHCNVGGKRPVEIRVFAFAQHLRVALRRFLECNGDTRTRGKLAQSIGAQDAALLDQLRQFDAVAFGVLLFEHRLIENGECRLLAGCHFLARNKIVRREFIDEALAVFCNEHGAAAPDLQCVRRGGVERAGGRITVRMHLDERELQGVGADRLREPDQFARSAAMIRGVVG